MISNPFQGLPWSADFEPFARTAMESRNTPQGCPIKAFDAEHFWTPFVVPFRVWHVARPEF